MRWAWELCNVIRHSVLEVEKSFPNPIGVACPAICYRKREFALADDVVREKK